MKTSSGGNVSPPGSPFLPKTSVAGHSRPHSASSHTTPTMFFLRSEAEIEKSFVESTNAESTMRQQDSTYGVESLADTLEAAFGKADKDDGNKSRTLEPSSEETEESKQKSVNISERDSHERPESSKTSQRKQHTRHILSHNSPLTPLTTNTASPVPEWAMSNTPRSVSLQSLRLSDEESVIDEGASQAIISSGEEEEEETEPAESSSFPQLVMPSIQMPSRRPFTTKGKAMGKLKVLVAGEAGLGKTSLIRSIVQLCEDIVHVDPMSPSISGSRLSASKESKPQRRKSQPSGTTQITEIHASTKAYPHWWAESEENRVSHRRKSVGDSVLERNICFVDTPGFGRSSSATKEIIAVVDYVESLLVQNATVGTMDDNDLLGVISGNGGVQVDVVIYLLSPTQDISKDIYYMRRLSSLTNVIPIIAKADSVTLDEILAIKTSILARLQTTSIKPFLFGKQLDDALLEVQGLAASIPPLDSTSSLDSSTEPNSGPLRNPTHPYAISSLLGPDNETMDASLLMSSEYMQPLLPSELAYLVAEIFNPDSISWLRYSAARKFLAWRRHTDLSHHYPVMHGLGRGTHGPPSHSSLGLNGSALNGKNMWVSAWSKLTSTSAFGTDSIISSTTPSGVLVPRPNSPYYVTNSNWNSNLHSPFSASSPSLSHTEGLDHPTDFSLARYYDQMHREEQFAEVRLAKWATDLQRSLRNERERYEELQRMERAKWLLEKVGEEVRDGSIVTSPTNPKGADWAVVRRSNRKEAGDANQRYGRGGRFDTRDPLGLCELGDEFRRKSFVLVKVLGGMSVLGAVVVAVAKACGWESALAPEGGLWSWVTGSTE
ncbi:hypothetical protein GQ43DRAFT_423752 [Delitschia confertaspora ATCC 74209]|uniref:Septin-type G domain-containing protein n=1 Tax=Delitschia confertaspora ATCC 74209 TaxID=1513339 RepID=A0A9P4JES8_9PLEO|nr:hypothetical protein GQ43DRAFT_423752 [Delitschia confertaspora ATCC 74209]